MSLFEGILSVIKLIFQALELGQSVVFLDEFFIAIDRTLYNLLRWICQSMWSVSLNNSMRDADRCCWADVGVWNSTVGTVTTVCRSSITDTRSPPRFRSAYVTYICSVHSSHTRCARFSQTGLRILSPLTKLWLSVLIFFVVKLAGVNL